MIKKFYLTNKCDPNRYNHSESGWFLEYYFIAITLNSPKLQELSLTIRCILVSYLVRPLEWRVLPLSRDGVGVF